MTMPAIAFEEVAARELMVKWRSASNASDADTREGSAASDDETASTKSSCSSECAAFDGRAKGAALLAMMHALPQTPPQPTRTPLSSKAPAFKPGGARAKLSSTAASFVPKMPCVGLSAGECWVDPMAACGVWQGQAFPWLPLASMPAFAAQEPWGGVATGPDMPEMSVAPLGELPPPQALRPPPAAGAAPEGEPPEVAVAGQPEVDGPAPRAKCKTIVPEGKPARPRWADVFDDDSDDSDEVE